MENQKQKVEKVQGTETTKREMSNAYVAKQLLLNATRLLERKAISDDEFKKIKEIGVNVIIEDFATL